MKYILAKKIEMTQMFDEEGRIVPVTLVEAGPCEILQLKSKDKDGYEAVEIGFEPLKEKKITKSIRTKPYRYLKEFRGQEEERKVGDKVDASVFSEGDLITVSGVSKGKGFQGGVKRWGFHGKTATHGVKHEHRTIGSVGCSIPARVIKGKKMPGRTGSKRTTLKNLEIKKVDAKRNILAIKGAIPGRRGSLIEIRG
ncbi:MAG: 50S ribosomal protein L3 [Candidatus Pacebacteria bacterium]|nr:50S ribosomal protein L3 [Candidatus Paceibacterota bacterium]